MSDRTSFTRRPDYKTISHAVLISIGGKPYYDGMYASEQHVRDTVLSLAGQCADVMLANPEQHDTTASTGGIIVICRRNYYGELSYEVGATTHHKYSMKELL